MQQKPRHTKSARQPGADPRRKGGRIPLTYDPASEIVRNEHVPIVTGLSKETIWRRRRAGTFVPAIQLGDQAIGFRRSDIEAWLTSRTEGRESEIHRG